MNGWDELKAAALAGRLDRREFLMRSAALGVTAALSSSVLAGGALAAATPTKGGTLKLGLAGGSTTDSLDVRTYTDTVAFNVGYQIMNGLIEIDPKNKPTPELLESWNVEPGAKKWVFKVRQGITFHNGKTLDAEDILYSLNLHRGESKSPMVGPLKNIADAKATDKNEITITLTEG
ncbi:MAG: ABC transporter substrate-binding protein, partial [Dongiaceae bacterium]